MVQGGSSRLLSGAAQSKIKWLGYCVNTERIPPHVPLSIVPNLVNDGGKPGLAVTRAVSAVRWLRTYEHARCQALEHFLITHTITETQSTGNPSQQ